MTHADWIAVDWGTSTLRAWALAADGAVLDSARSDQGMSRLAPGREGFEPALLALADGWLAHGRVTPVVACGMVGSRQGWAEAPYRPVPVAPGGHGALKPATAQDPRLSVHLVCGVSQSNPPDVMRGEETQIAGLLSRAAGFEGVAVLPGTHAKWAQIVGGEIFHFASFMTGELYALIAGQSVLRHSIDPQGFDADAFAEAVSDSLSKPERFAARLFSVRAGDLLQGVAPQVAAARLSGWLLGLELAGARPYWLGQPIALVAGGVLADRYRAALDIVGAEVAVHDPDACVLAGLAAAKTHLAEAG